MASPDLSFGERKFRQSYNARFALAIFSGAVMYVVWFFSGEPALAPESSFSWLCVAVAFVNAAIFVAIGNIALTLSDNGVRHEWLFGMHEMRWDQITEARYWVRTPRPRVPVGMIGAIIAMLRRPRRIKMRLTLLADYGTQIKISPNYRNAREAIGIVLARIVPPMAASVRAKISRGETVSFGPLALSTAGVTWKNDSPIPIGSITRAEIAGRNLYINCDGRWTSAVKVNSERVPNVLVLLEVLEAIAPQLRPTRMDPLAKVRL